MLFLVFGVAVPLYLAIQHDLANQAKAVHPFLGVGLVLTVSFLAMVFQMRIYHWIRGYWPPRLFAKFVGLSAILCILLPSVSF